MKSKFQPTKSDLENGQFLQIKIQGTATGKTILGRGKCYGRTCVFGCLVGWLAWLDGLPGWMACLAGWLAWQMACLAKWLSGLLGDVYKG